MSDVVGSDAPRGGRGWGVVIGLAVVALVVATLRSGGGTPSASPSPSVTLDRIDGDVVPTTPPPRLSAPPGRSFGVTIVSATGAQHAGTAFYTARRDHEIRSYVPLRQGFAAVLVDESANRWTLVVRRADEDRTIAVDDGTSVLAGVTEDSFWTARPEFGAQRRDVRGDVVATERVPGPWSVAAASVAGLVVTDGQTTALWRGGRAEVLSSAAGYAGGNATHVVSRPGPCVVRCDVVVTDVRTRESWTLPSPMTGTLNAAAVNGTGDAVGFVVSSAGGWFVNVGRRGGSATTIAETPDFNEALSYFAIDWADDERLAVFDVSDDVAAFAYDLRTGRLTYAASFAGGGRTVALLADPA